MKIQILISDRKLEVILTEDKDGFFAHCPELKGCHTQGKTEEETLKNIKEAAALYLETITNDNLS
jgi:predicted RNase H-like HicB family nuclease